jgi:phospholipase A1
LTRIIFILLLSLTSSQSTAQQISDVVKNVKNAVKKEDDKDSIFNDRTEAEERMIDQAFAITQYRNNYILPYTYVSNPNPLGNSDLTPENTDNQEAKYQLSFKFPLMRTSDDTDGIYFGFTLVSYWQVYNEEVSRPFRETNYEPELFYQWQTDYEVFGVNFNGLRVGVNHQSNGQSALRSRSWNRIFLSSMFSRQNDFYYFKAWYRLPEDEKEDPLDPTGDDNPDIEDFMGRAEFGYGRQFDDLMLTFFIRNNLKTSDNRGSIEVNATYPINERYSWMLQYFNGYGDSLIDYNRAQERIGIGIQLRLL